GNACVAGTPQTCPVSCDAASGCVQCNTSADCAAASCNGNMYVAASTCTGNTCVAGTSTACASPTGACDAASGCVECNTNADCAPASCKGSTYTPASTCTG